MDFLLCVCQNSVINCYTDENDKKISVPVHTLRWEQTETRVSKRFVDASLDRYILPIYIYI